jgi:hypothetical protein
MDLAWAESLAPSDTPRISDDEVLDVELVPVPDSNNMDASDFEMAVPAEEFIPFVEAVQAEEFIPFVEAVQVEEVIPFVEAVPAEEAIPFVEDASPFIAAELVQPTSAPTSGPFIEAVVVETARANAQPTADASDWLADFAPPAPPIDATLDWIKELADAQVSLPSAPPPPALPPATGPKPDWLDDLG